MKKIKKNVLIIYKDGISESFEAIRQIDNGIIFGRIIDNKFVDCGFVSNDNIKKIEMINKK